MNLLQRVSLQHTSLPPLFFSDTLRLSGTLRKIGYLYLGLSFPQTQSTSPPPLLLFAPVFFAVGFLERSALNPELLLCSINEGKAENLRGGGRLRQRQNDGLEAGRGEREEGPSFGSQISVHVHFSLSFVPQTHRN